MVLVVVVVVSSWVGWIGISESTRVHTEQSPVRSFVARIYVHLFECCGGTTTDRTEPNQRTDGGFAGLLLLLLHDEGGSGGGGGVGRGLANERAVGATACWLQQIGLIGRTRVSSA